MPKTYSGKYKVKNPEKYHGNANEVTYRSMWEKYCMMFFDGNSSVKSWSSEEVTILYYYDVDKRYHRYFVDFKVSWKNGQTSLIEVKPHKETLPPTGNRKTKRYITEGLTYVKNQNKWKAAEEYCKDHKWKFEIWTEIELEQMGIMPKLAKPLKPFSRKKKR